MPPPLPGLCVRVGRAKEERHLGIGADVCRRTPIISITRWYRLIVSPKSFVGPRVWTGRSSIRRCLSWGRFGILGIESGVWRAVSSIRTDTRGKSQISFPACHAFQSIWADVFEIRVPDFWPVYPWINFDHCPGFWLLLELIDEILVEWGPLWRCGVWQRPSPVDSVEPG